MAKYRNSINQQYQKLLTTCYILHTNLWLKSKSSGAILHEVIENKKFELTQKELAEKFGFSLSTVFNALKVPRQSGAIEATGRNFIVRDTEKFLYLWATERNIERDTQFMKRKYLFWLKT